jgi:OmcA/MtrC family decaheme c-type cytochrome
VFASLILLGGASVAAQEIPLAWQASKYFRYNVETVTVSGSTVKVVFSVSNPLNGQAWDILAADPFKGGSASTLRVLVGWSSTEHTNTGSSNGSLNPIFTTAQGGGAALPITINALSATAPAKRCADASDCPGVPNLVNRFWVSATVFPLAFPGGQVTSGVVAVEGHPACATSLPGCPQPVLVNGVPTLANVPVTAVTRSFSFGSGTAAARRQIVDINKCKVCHNDTRRDGVLIPKLSLHGGNRTENLSQCAVCHNPNQTDIPYRTAGAETPIDFKTMVHSIHAGGLRDNPFVVVGFRGTVFDFSTVRFPSSLRNCVTCHIDQNGRGTFELPLSASVLGTTIQTGSVPAAAGLTRKIDVDPFNDVKITPTAAVCSSCHDDRETRSHMTRHGASFSTTQQNIIPGGERCANCHGRGREKDVRRVHEIRSGTSSRD